MSGHRLGFVYASEGYINHMLKIHDAFVVCANGLAQFGAIEALKSSRECVKYFVEDLHKRRDQICAGFDQLKGLFSYHSKP